MNTGPSRLKNVSPSRAGMGFNMIQVIDGKRYNTEKANRVFDWVNGHMTIDLYYRKKVLYQTQNGAWFIHHKGGAFTDMAVKCGNACIGNFYSGSEKIEPVSEEDAFRFLQAHTDEEDAMQAIEKHFADRADRIVDA